MNALGQTEEKMRTDLRISPLIKIGPLSFSSSIVIVTLAVEESLLGIPSSVTIASNCKERQWWVLFLKGTNESQILQCNIVKLLYKCFKLSRALTVYTETVSLSSSPKSVSTPVVLSRKKGLFLIAVCPYVTLELGFYHKIFKEEAVSFSLLASTAKHHKVEF